MGKPTIATGYSGNLEFMNEANSILVPYKLVQIGHSDYPNAEGRQWAEPDIENAAQKMQELVSDESLQERISESVALNMRQYHSYAKVGAEIKQRLKEISLKNGAS